MRCEQAGHLVLVRTGHDSCAETLKAERTDKVECAGNEGKVHRFLEADELLTDLCLSVGLPVVVLLKYLYESVALDARGEVGDVRKVALSHFGPK